jgi:predicted DNA-binding protein YlxM (UPF0122 family)
MKSNLSIKKELTDNQKEVWETVLTYTNLIIKGKVEDFLEYFHEDYSGWDYLDDEPVVKSAIAKEIKNSLPKRRDLFYKIKPASIKIFENTAVVHYYFSIIPKNEETNVQMSVGHYTDILLKQNGKWILVGDHVGKFTFESIESRFLLNK